MARLLNSALFTSHRRLAIPRIVLTCCPVVSSLLIPTGVWRACSTPRCSPPTTGWLSRAYAYLLPGHVPIPHSCRRVARLLNSALFTFQGGFDRQLREALGPLFPEGLLPSLAEGASAAIQVCKFWCSGAVACKAGCSFTTGCLSATHGQHAVSPLHDQRLMMATRLSIVLQELPDAFQATAASGCPARSSFCKLAHTPVRNPSNLQELLDAFPFQAAASSDGLARYSAGVLDMVRLSDEHRRQVIRAMRRFRWV